MTASPTVVSVVETAPLSPGQERLIAAEFALSSGNWPPQGSPTRMRPLDTGAIHIAGPLDVAALRTALAALTARQSALRTGIRQLPDGTPVQLVLRQLRVPFSDSALSWPPTANLPSGRHLAHQAGPSTVDPRRDWMFRAHLIRLGHHRHVLLLQIHHMVSDGWSIGVLYRDLSALYNAAMTGAKPSLPDLPRSFAWFSRQMHAERSGTAHDKQLRYWRERLAPPLTAPPGTRRGSSMTNPVGVEPVTIEAASVSRLRAASGEADHRGGLAGGFLAALALVLHHATGATDVRIGMMVSNRARPDAEHLVGYFVNTAVIRLRTTPESTAGRLVSAASLAVTEAIENQALPIQDLVQHLRDTGAMGPDPLYDVTVALNTMRTGSLNLAGLACEDVDVEPHRPRQAPTSIAQRWVLEELAGQLTGTLTYRTDILSRAAARAVLSNLGRAMQAVTDRQAVTADIVATFDRAAQESR